MKIMSVAPSPNVKAFRDTILTLMREVVDSGKLTAEEVLALMAYTTGQALALQNQRTMTPAQGLELIEVNVVAGNRDAIEKTFAGAKGTPQ